MPGLGWPPGTERQKEEDTMTQAVVEYQAPRELALPDRAYLERELKAVREFQGLVRQLFVEGHDYGVIPGTNKPSMLKPGAEKMAKLLGLADIYEIVDKVEDWERPFFRYLVLCKLVSVATGSVISTSMGECNSYESRYRWRWLFKSQLPPGNDGSGLVTKTINTKNGRATQYRMENEDIHSQINTLVKMAQKRALVGAALSAGRLSDVFTQDLEDLAANGVIEGVAEEVSAPPPIPQPAPAAQSALVTDAQLRKLFGDAHRAGWTDESLKQHVITTYGIESSRDLTKVQSSEIIDYIAEGKRPAAAPTAPEQGVMV